MGSRENGKGVIKIKVKNIVSIVSGAIGSLLINLIGKPTDDLIILIVLMIVDLIVGFLFLPYGRKAPNQTAGSCQVALCLKE